MSLPSTILHPFCNQDPLFFLLPFIFHFVPFPNYGNPYFEKPILRIALLWIRSTSIFVESVTHTIQLTINSRTLLDLKMFKIVALLASIAAGK